MEYINIDADDMNFVDDSEYTSLYPITEIRNNDIVEARYIRVNGHDKDPFICALPRIRTGRELSNSITREYLGYDKEKEMLEDDNTKMCHTLEIKSLRFQFSIHKKLEREIYNCLVSSYENRKLGIIRDKNGKAGLKSTINNQINSNPQCFSMIGTPGSGKSTALGMITAKYPRAIRHRFKNGCATIQIPIISVTASPNSNMNALLESIVIKFEDILEDTTHEYQHTLNRQKGIDGKAGYIAELFRLAHVGLLVIDEVQFMDFSSQTQKSFENVITVMARSGTSIGIIGTEEVEHKLSDNGRLTRRFLCNKIKSDEYCDDLNVLDICMDALLQYQWTNKISKDSKAIKEELYAQTRGNIDLLTTLYMRLQQHCILHKDAVLDAKLVRKLGKERMATARDLISDAFRTSALYEEDIVDELIENGHSAQAIQNDNYKTAMKEKEEGKFKKVLHELHSKGGFEEPDIRMAYEKLRKEHDFSKYSIKDIKRVLYEYLESITKKEARKNSSERKVRKKEDNIDFDSIKAKLEKTIMQ